MTTNYTSLARELSRRFRLCSSDESAGTVLEHVLEPRLIEAGLRIADTNECHARFFGHSAAKTVLDILREELLK